MSLRSLVALLAAVVAAGPAAAANFAVISNADSGPCTLRASILLANATPAADTITFNLAAGQRTIALAGALPTVTAPLDINGTSQPGWNGVPLIRIDGVALGPSEDALRIDADSATLRGVMVTRAPGAGLAIQGGVGVHVHSSYFGTDGSVALGNGTGVRIDGGALHSVGEAVAGRHNVLSGNTSNGLSIGDAASFNQVLNNRVGTNAAGTAAIPNGYAGLRLFGNDNVIGSSGTGGNLISGNTRFGVENAGDSNSFYNNRIGTDLAGNAALPNETGVSGSGSDTQFGGVTDGSGNLVSGNSGSGIVFSGNGATIVGNRIGTRADGNAALPNGTSGVVLYGAGHVVGSSGAGNLLSGNGRSGLDVGTGSHAVVIAYNRVGTNAAGTAAIPNSIGLEIAGNDVVVGGSVAAGNLLSGNASNGVTLIGEGNVVSGNRIGTNAAGVGAIGNGYAGIRVFGSGHRIGGTDVGNVIGGNLRYGIEIDTDASDIEVQANRIGLGSDGSTAVPNDTGISNSGDNVVIGGNTASDTNWIGGNIGVGVSIGGNADATQVRGNRIGLATDGSARGNGATGIGSYGGHGTVFDGNVVSNNGRGIEVAGAPTLIRGNIIGLDAQQATQMRNGGASGIALYSGGHTVGGPLAGDGNSIVAAWGIVLAEGADANVIEGNFIGTNAAQTQVFGSGYAGMNLYRANANTIGGTAAGSGNVIRGAGFGVYVALGTGNAVLGNSIAGNDLSGIELDPIGPSGNDAGDADHGPNEGQNRPVLTAAQTAGSDVVIAGTLQSRANRTYRIEFFHGAACHVSGLGEGERFLGAIDATTAANGAVALAATLANPHGSGVITATATDADGNTSEFSPCIDIGAPGPGRFTLWRDPYLAYEDVESVTVHVLRSGGLTGNTSVRLRTVDDSATAPADYSARDVVLNFASGEWIRTVAIPLTLDADSGEGTENFDVELSAATGGATIALPAVDVLLFDHAPSDPFLGIDPLVTVTEPASGQAMANFTIRLSPTDHDVRVGYETFDGTATAGSDYLAVDGMVTFEPGQRTKTVQVPVLADTVGEIEETFHLRLIGQGDPLIAYTSEAQASIVDADGGEDALFRDGFE